QRLAIARALMTTRALLVLEEPLEGLAPIVVEELAGAIRRMTADEGTAFILVEQHAEIALSLTDTALVLERGSVAHRAPSRELLQDRPTLDPLPPLPPTSPPPARGGGGRGGGGGGPAPARVGGGGGGGGRGESSGREGFPSPRRERGTEGGRGESGLGRHLRDRFLVLAGAHPALGEDLAIRD